VANPCGLIAKYLFTDSYTLLDSSNNTITIGIHIIFIIFIDETNIAHSVDKKYKFISPGNASAI
jgi:hypothetical protein